MPFYRVRTGQSLGHHGHTFAAGSVVDLPVVLAREVAHLVEPCTDKGVSLAHLSAEDLEIAQALPHERVTLEKRKAARLAAAPPPPPPKTPIVVAKDEDKEQ